MADRPAQAAHDGRKRQTLRPAKPPFYVYLKHRVYGDGPFCVTNACAGRHEADLNRYGAVSVKADNGKMLGVKPDEFHWECPFGNVGDRLWVRECWSPDHKAFYPHFSDVYRAACSIDVENGKTYSPEQKQWYPFRWRPNIHMPRRACRTVLEITKIRVHKIQVLSFDDWVADFCPTDHEKEQALASFMGRDYQMAHAKERWDKHYGGTEFEWDADPWTWAISFKRT